MEKMKLSAQLRTEIGKGVARKLRARGMVPAVAYGSTGQEPISLALCRRDMVNLMQQPTGRYMPFDLEVDGKCHQVVLRDYQVHAVSRVLLHCDLQFVDENHAVRVAVPIVTSGRSKGEAAGGKLIMARREMELRCRPQEIPEKIEIDIREMELGHVCYSDQIALPAGVIPVVATRYPVVCITKGKAGADEFEKPAAAAAAAAEEGAAAAPAEKS